MKYLRLLLPAICLSILALSTSHAAEGWNTDYQAALAQAKKENKKVMLNFTGSTWCPPCMKLAKDTFSKPEFKEFAEANLALVDLDFPVNQMQASAQNKELAQQYEIRGFPTLILLDSHGKEITRHVGFLPGGPNGFIAWVNDARAK